MASAPRQAEARAKPPGAVRIIGGQWRSRLLPVPQQDGLRPTPDRVRETLFNWLGQDLAGWYCLDAFAGTGALGFEAASRHAAQVRMVEANARVARHLQQSASQLAAANVQVSQGDGLLALGQRPPGHAAGWDAIFLDPPFASQLDEPALAQAAGVLASHGFVYLESARQWPQDVLAGLGWHLHRYLRAGAVHAHLLQCLPGG